MIGYTTSHGKISYSDDVIANIIGMATMECYGVVGMAAKNATDGFWELIKIEHLDKGVKVAQKGGELNIEVFVVVEYGTKISVIANNIIQKVRYNVENFTGLKVTGITVNIEGVRI
ncbi:MAG: Asp23/Gls24 family envelope stress response protein [Clostridiaceae bacterium]